MKVHPEGYKNAYKRKKREKSEDVGGMALFAASLRHQTTEFFNNSTLHGVRYIAEKERPFCEKFVSF
ncbi:Pickpocket 23 short form [Operophtera brumata]|uniref:Pickpocket 23 short form n=1 Tax=Operophtera brumata TaxID=104452 RepID=A0A0L7LGY7_OPEBR|nr:Pickpocket 23 short form [Operophtera brumata]